MKRTFAQFAGGTIGFVVYTVCFFAGALVQLWMIPSFDVRLGIPPEVTAATGTVQVRVQSPSVDKKSLEFRSSDLCIRAEAFPFCFQSLDLGLNLAWVSWNGALPKIQATLRLEANGESPDVKAKQPKTKRDKTEGLGKWIASASVRAASGDILRLQLDSSHGHLKARQPTEPRGDVKWVLSQRNGLYQFRVDAGGIYGPVDGKADIDGTWNGNQLKSKLALVASFPEFGWRVATTELGCKIDAALDANAELHCPLAARPLGIAVDPKRMAIVGIEVKVAKTSELNGIAEGNLPAGEWKLDFADFSNWVHVLRRSPYAVPQPLSPLVGRIFLHGTTRGKEVPFELVTTLNSQTQNFEVRSEGKLEWASDAKAGMTLHADTEFKNVALILPHFTLTKPPQLFPDTRLNYGPQEEDGETTFHYDLKFRTGSRPIYLITNLARSRVPVSFNVSVSSEAPISGSIRVDPFEVEWFRRVAQMRRFEMNLRPEMIPIRGKIVIPYTDYILTLDIQGTAEKPTMHLSSEPALPENELYSVLLFGQRLSSLDSSQMKSLGQTQAAVADGAVNLLSMYVLASTPIESVGYDAATKTFVARVRVADGTTLNIGADETADQRLRGRIGFRKRLGAGLSITTDFREPWKQFLQIPTTMLEWSISY